MGTLAAWFFGLGGIGNLVLALVLRSVSLKLKAREAAADLVREEATLAKAELARLHDDLLHRAILAQAVHEQALLEARLPNYDGPTRSEAVYQRAQRQYHMLGEPEPATLRATVDRAVT